MNRRDTLKLALAALAAPALIGRAAAQTAAPATTFSLPPLGYAYEALEPHIDTMTMTIHHQRHHNAFIGNLNNLVARVPDLATKSVDAILSDLGAVPEAARTAVRNNLGGHFNHTFFWDLMTPGGAKAPAGDLAAAINQTFGDATKMREAMNQAGLTRFGSGWAWLVVDKDKKLRVVSTANQDPPHLEGQKAVLGVDVWEHAYYLKYQNRRGDYLNTWWNTVNWDKAMGHFRKAVA
jgi:Fe-Mn family superoxide dismutase